jgi:peroxin-6
MSLIFDAAQSVGVFFTVKTLPDKNGLDTVLVSKDVWSRFDQLGHDRVALSIHPVQSQHSSRQKGQSLKALTCWAVLDEDVSFIFCRRITDRHVYLQVASLSVPPKWLETFRHIFPHSVPQQIPPQITHTATRTMPVLLTEIIVSALSDEAYHVASSRDSPLETWLSNESIILRQGTIYAFDSEFLPTNGRVTADLRRTYRYRLDMTEPVLQGYSRIGHTRFYVILVVQANDDLSLEDEMDLGWGEQSGSDPGGIEIDESFLASSVLHPRQNLPSNRKDSTCLFTNGHQYLNGELEETSTSHTDSQLRVELTPEPTSMPQDDYTLFLRTSDLGKIGVLDGDWASLINFIALLAIYSVTQAIAELTDASDSRLVRISARDDLVKFS